MPKQRRQTREVENPDPHEQYHPIPKLLLGLVIGLVVWAGFYILKADPDGPPALGDSRPPVALAVAAASDKGGAIDGKQIFTAACQACHQATGQGLPGVFPPLAGASWVTGDPEVLTQIVLHGVTGPIEVAGATYNGAMPGFAGQFSDAELAAVLSFIRSEWGNAKPAIDAAAVGASRAATADRSAPWAGGDEVLKHVAPGS